MIEPIQIELPVPWGMNSVNVFLVNSAEPTLIDAGMRIPQHEEALAAGLAPHGLTIADIQHIIITHAHVDHLGGAGWLCEKSDAKVWVSDLVYDWAVDVDTMWDQRVTFLSSMLEKIGLPAERNETIRNGFRGMVSIWDSVPADRLVRFAIDGTVPIGGYDYEVIYTPGHAVHQTCFYQRELGWLFSADCILHRTPVPVLEQNPSNPGIRIAGLPQHLDSLDKLAALDATCTFPGHGNPMADHRAVITHQKKRIKKRKEECNNLVAAGHHTLPELTDSMYSHIPYNSRFTPLSTVIGYLDLLIAENRITQTTQNGTWHYNANNNSPIHQFTN